MDHCTKGYQRYLRAAKLLAMLRMRKRYVLNLDDLWEEFELEEIGIPEPTRDMKF